MIPINSLKVGNYMVNSKEGSLRGKKTIYVRKKSKYFLKIEKEVLDVLIKGNKD